MCRAYFVFAFWLTLCQFGMAEDGSLDKYSVEYVTEKVSVPIYSEPSASKLIGYIPGASKVVVEFNGTYERNGFIKFNLLRGDSKRAWIKKSDVIRLDKYTPYTGNWPLAFIWYSSGEGTDVMSLFPKSNDCESASRQDLKKKIPNNIKIEQNKIICTEVWHAKNTNLYYLIGNKQHSINAWVDAKKNIYVNSIFGVEIGSIIYGFNNGKTVFVVKNCDIGRDVGCNEGVASSVKLSTKHSRLPIQSFEPYR